MTREMSRIIYVMSYAPSLTGWDDNERVGGFEWRDTWEEAVETLRYRLNDGDSGHDYTLRSFLIPEDLEPPEITDLLEAEREMRDLPIPHEWVGKHR